MAPRVLVIRLGAIGDVVNALVFASALVDADPDTRIGWAAHDLVLPLLERNPVVDRVHHWPRAAGVRGGFALARELRAARYDVAVDLQRIAKSAALARYSGAERVVGFDRARTKEGAWLLTTERVAPGPADEHMVDRYLAVARHLGAPQAPPRWSLPTDDAAERAIEMQLGDTRPIVVNLGASKPKNRWSASGFAEVVRELAADGPVAVTGGPDDRALFPELFAELPPGVLDLVGRTNLLELAALARRARTVVTCDTGPMHIAVATGAPVVALFGPADPGRTGPYGAGHRIVRPRGESRRMADLEARDVVAAVRAQFEDSSR
ncbi:MAG: glycosyltransferase family 9 protein [Planctomycetota bacterium]